MQNNTSHQLSPGSLLRVIPKPGMIHNEFTYAKFDIEKNLNIHTNFLLIIPIGSILIFIKPLYHKYDSLHYICYYAKDGNFLAINNIYVIDLL